MKITNITELIRNSKQIIDWVTNKNETVIIHRQRGADMVIISFKEWNTLKQLAVSPTYNKPYNKETQEAIQKGINGDGETISNPKVFFKEL